MSYDYDTLKHEYVNANGIRMHCVTMGDGDGPLIVFLHGFPEFWYLGDIRFLSLHRISELLFPICADMEIQINQKK